MPLVMNVCTLTIILSPNNLAMPVTSGEILLQEAPGCFEAEVMGERSSALGTLDTRARGFGCPGMTGHAHTHAARRVLGAFFSCEAPD